MTDNRYRQVEHRSPRGIGIIGTYPPPFGGVSTHIRALSAFIRKKGVCYCRVYNTGGMENRAEGVHTVYSLKELFLTLMKSKDIINHAHGGVDLYRKMIILYLVRLMKGTPYLVTVHSGGVNEDLAGRKRSQKRLLYYLFNGAEKIICVSDKIRMSVASIGIRPEKCVVIPAFSLNTRLNENDVPSFLRDFLNHHSPILSCLGFNFEEYYGFHLAIEALNRLKPIYPKIGLLIMGGDRSSLAFKSLMARFTPDDLNAVTFTGGIPHKAVLSVINRSDAFLRPTYHDGDANSVREAIAMNTPVVASDTEERPVGVELFRIGDLEEMVQKIHTALDSARNKEAKSRVVDVTNLEAVLDVYLQILPRKHLIKKD